MQRIPIRVSPRRRGVLIYVFLGFLTVFGGLVLGLDVLARTRSRLAHKAAFTRVAENLAESAALYLHTRIREVLSWEGRSENFPRDLSQGSLFAFLLLPAGQLEPAIRAQGGEALFERWFGPDWRVPLDDLEGMHPGSSIRIQLLVLGKELSPGGFRDPFEKTIEWGFVARGAYRGVEVELRRTFPLKVVHTLPPLTSKFTLFVEDVPSPQETFNLYQNREDGGSSGSRPQRPFVLLNTPLGELSDREWMASNLARMDAGRHPWEEQDELRKVLSQRGAVYLGSGAGNPETIRLQLTAGPTLFQADGTPVPQEHGEFFQLFDPIREYSQPATYRLVPEGNPPPLQKKLSLPDGREMSAQVHFLYWGFQADPLGELAPSRLDQAARTMNSSILHLFGRDDEPSRTFVYGPIEQSFLRVSYLGIDRKVGADRFGPDDEDVQRQNLYAAGAANLSVRTRDIAAPILAHVESPRVYSQDLAREGRGERPLFLDPFPTAAMGLSPPENKNFGYDRDGDGRMDTVLDPGHPTVDLPSEVFNYRSLFGELFQGTSGPSYQDVASRIEVVPYPHMIDFMVYGGRIPPEKHPKFPGFTQTRIEAAQRAQEVEFSFGDPWHRDLESSLAFQGDLSDFLGSEDLKELWRRRATRTFPNAEAFFQAYPRFPNPFAPQDPRPWLRLDEVVRIEQGSLDLEGLRILGSGAIVLEEGDLRVADLTPHGQSMASFVALRGDLELSGSGPIYGFFQALEGELHFDGTKKQIRGGIAVRSLRGSTLEAGGDLRYDAAGDFTRDHLPDQGGYMDFYRAVLQTNPIRWSRGRS